MKKLNLHEFEIVELSQKEMKEISGGWFWIILGIVASLISAAAAIIDYANQQAKK